MQEITQKIRENKKIAIAVIGMVIVAFIYNTLTPYSADDFSYMHNFADGTRITNPFQIIPSLWEHYLNINGRIMPHVFVQFFLMFPKFIYNIVNAVVYVGLVWLMLKITGEKKFSILLYVAIIIALWMYIPAYGQVFLWLTGSSNYSWAFFFSMIYMFFYVGLYRNPEKLLTNSGIVGLSVYSLFFGAYSEMVSFPVIFVCFILVCIVMYEEKNVFRYWKYCVPMVTGAIGYLTLVLCPGKVTTKSGLTIGLLFKNFIDVFEGYYQCTRVLLISWAVLLVVVFYLKIDRKAVVISTCFLLISVIAMAMLSVARYVVARHYAITVFYLFVAVLVLLQALRENGKIECITYAICAYVIATSLWTLWDGTYDIYNVYRQNEAREIYIKEQIAAGYNEVTVPVIMPLTSYSCKYDLIDVRMDDADPWPNVAIASYYGLEKIYGKKAE